MSNQLFARKSLGALLAEAEGDNRLKRVLGPVTLTSLGVGAIIGAGIFVATGAAAKDVAGPALMLSYVVAGLTCIFAALCYAEFASMAPVAGSAYTYAYCTMGELFAWIIGWDLVLEYAVGASAVANGWSGYFQSVLGKVGIVMPMALCAAPVIYDEGAVRSNVYAEYRTVETKDGKDKETTVRATHKLVKLTYLGDKVVEKREGRWVRVSDGQAVADAGDKEFEKTLVEKRELKWANTGDGKILGPVGDTEVEKKFHSIQQAWVNLPAVLIVLLVTAVLVKGISESAGFNALMVGVKVGAVLFVIVVGAFFINPKNWTDDFAPNGYGGFSFFGIETLTIGKTSENGTPLGMLAGAAIIFFAYIGFDSVSTHAEEAKNPKKDVPIGIIASLILCTVLYVAVVAVLTGMVKYSEIDKDAGVSSAFKARGLYWAEVIIAIAGVAGITSVLLVMMLSGPRVFLAMARDGLVPRGFFADVHPTFRTPWKSTIAIGVFVMILAGLLPIDALLHLTNIGTLFAFAIVCAAVLIMRRTNPNAHRPFRCPLVPVVPILGIGLCLMLMLSLPVGNWARLLVWLGLGLLIYFLYGRHHSLLGKELQLGAPLGGPGKGGDGFLPSPPSPSTDITDRSGTQPPEGR
jgi:APA family basic amino acid/polyamine antiporter